jgi:hypothetical protein
MPVFTPNVAIETATPTIEVSNDANIFLAVGVHTFQLVVTDDSGNASQPALVEVIVRDSQSPTAVLDGPGSTEAGASFSLSGARSSDVAPGRVVSYAWTLVSDPSRPVVVNPGTIGGIGIIANPVISPISPVINPVIR